MAEQTFIEVDTSRWPLVVVELVGSISDPDFELYLMRMSEVLQREGTRALVYDASRCGMVPPSQRRMKADWLKAHEDRIRECTAGLGFVLPNPIIRGTLTAILWLTPMPAPHAVVGDLPTAIDRCRGWLDGHGVYLST